MLMLIWRWENYSRWYEAEFCYDLFGDLLLIQGLGGLGYRLNVQNTKVVSDLLTGIAQLHAIDRQRRKRKNPYHQVE
ncbi:hypothetical protein ARSQ2_01857 [Arsenophonus endosymbiont of Bemisia tabaci Q2]|nr:hypothetical protein ARSQ2_01857 [Arsenophonus endosymbiont of Bemisia tabaci Q2]